LRKFRWLIIVLFVLPWLASDAIAPALASEDVSGGWRRTRQGWQRVELVRPAIQYRRPALHPAVVGSLEVLLTMTAMLALSNERRAEHANAGPDQGASANAGPP
jgi:predicted metal-dependent hydrolase